MYILINAQKASKYELETVYTLDEALKLWALYRMEMDIEAFHADELKKQSSRRR